MVKITDELLKRTFKNTFLELVAFEVRFPTDLTIHEKISKFQGSIKEVFPIYSERFVIPAPFQGNIEKSNLLDYVFKNNEKELEIYLNTYSVFGLRTKRYPNFKEFSELFFNMLNKFIEICKLRFFTRIGLRYINIIPLDENLEKSNNLIKKYFDLLMSEKFKDYNFDNQIIDLRYKKNSYEIHHQFHFRKNPNDIYEVIFDLDNSFKGKVDIENNLEELKAKVDDLHRFIKIIFFEMIKEDFLNKLKDREV